MIYNRSLKDPVSSKNIYENNFLPFYLGRDALIFLINHLEIDSIFLPSNICPTLIEIIEKNNLKVFFYGQFKEGTLEVDSKKIEHELTLILSKEKISFFLWHDFLNILGDMPEELYSFLEKKQIEVIIDAVHSLPTYKYKSEIVIYGFRKIFSEPFGAFLKVNKKLHGYPSIKLEKYLIYKMYFKIKLRILSLLRNGDNRFLDLILKSICNLDQRYNPDLISDFSANPSIYPKLSKLLRNKDLKKVCELRQRNYRIYNNFFNSKDLNSMKLCPYGFPLIIENNTELRKKLWDEGIHTFILWKENKRQELKNINSFFSKKILILPVNHDLPEKDIMKIIAVINDT